MANYRRIYGPAAATTGDTAIFTGVANFKYKIRSLIVCNTSASSGTFNFAINGTSATAANCLFNTQTVAGNTTSIFYPEAVTVGTQTINALASATSITFTVNAEEIPFTS